MDRKLLRYEIATIRKTAQIVNPFVSKRQKLESQINSMREEIESLREKQEQYEIPIRNMTGGYNTEQLVDKVVEVVGRDKNNKEIKAAKYVLKYPDTIIPPRATESNENENENPNTEDHLHMQNNIL